MPTTRPGTDWTRLNSAQLAAHYAKSKQSRGGESFLAWPCLPSCNSTQRYSEQPLQLQQLLGWPFVGFCFVLIREGEGGGRARVTNLVLSSLSASRHLYNSLSCTFFMLFLWRRALSYSLSHSLSLSLLQLQTGAARTAPTIMIAYSVNCRSRRTANCWTMISGRR